MSQHDTPQAALAPIPQGTTVTLKHDIQFPNPHTGRHNTWRAGSGYWTASTQLVQEQQGIIEVCKRGRPMGSGMRFPLALFSEHFDVVG